MQTPLQQARQRNQSGPAECRMVQEIPALTSNLAKRTMSMCRCPVQKASSLWLTDGKAQRTFPLSSCKRPRRCDPVAATSAY
jgi:hypothetical protein